MTLSDLIANELTADLEWREAELAVMRKNIYASTRGSVQERVMLRAGVAMLYAHYEGFCKFGLEIYIDTLEKLGLKRRDLIWTLAAHSLKSFHSEMASQGTSTQFFSKLMLDMNAHLDATASYERPPQIANLWPDLLIRWLTTLGLSSHVAASNYTLLESLVNNRNQIAHGKKLIVKTRDDFDQFSKAGLLAMHELAVEVVSALQTQSYKLKAPTQTTFNHAA